MGVRMYGFSPTDPFRLRSLLLNEISVLPMPTKARLLRSDLFELPELFLDSGADETEVSQVVSK